MPFSIESELAGQVARLTLRGELDAAAAPVFKSEIEGLAVASPRHLVLFTSDLTFMASAGLRVLIFAKQKLGSEVSIYLVSPRAPVVDTLQKTGFFRSVYIVDREPGL